VKIQTKEESLANANLADSSGAKEELIVGEMKNLPKSILGSIRQRVWSPDCQVLVIQIPIFHQIQQNCSSFQ